MTKRMLIDATHAEETRVVVLDGNRLEDFDVETATKKQLKGNIYLAKIVRVEPSLQAAFVEYGGNRHGFLAFGEIHPDYYQIPIADRQRLLEQEAEQARAEEAAEDAAADVTADVTAWREPQARPAAAAADPASAEATVGRNIDALAGDSLAADADAADGVPEAMTAARAEAAAIEPESIAGDAESPYGPEPAAAEKFASEPAGDPEPDAAEPPLAAEPAELDADPVPPEAPPPETLGGEADGAEEAQERRIPSRYLRNYKIQEVIRRRQIMLVQVVKEERGTKGAALTTYISLAGRYCVLMPNSLRGGGISRKITSLSDRRRLKEVMAELDIPKGMGLIVRTAGANRPKAEIKRDCEYLLRLWDDIRETTLRSVAPSLIYEEASLIKRAIRDVYSRDVDEVAVDGEEGWRAAHEFMRMLMPTHARKVILWSDRAQPLFAKYQVEAQLDAMLLPTVQLRSGGYLVINQTEALVAIDVNSGRSTRERGIEETALRTNQEAAEEVARQLRLRDLAGLIVIDFIDMEAKRHNSMVERRLKEALKNDRARLQVGHISHFGLLEMTRQRLRPSLAETSFVLCPNCGGTGHIRSTESAAIHVLRGIEEEAASRRAAEIRVHVGGPIAMYILNYKRDRLHDVELRYGVRVSFEADDALVAPQMRIERLRPQVPPEPPVTADQASAPSPEPEAAAAEPAEPAPEVEAPAEAIGNGEAEEAQSAEEIEHRRRRRRRRRRGVTRREEGVMPEGAEQPEIPEPGEREPAYAGAAIAVEFGFAGSVTEPGLQAAEPSALGAAATEPAELPAAEESAARRRTRRGGRRRRPETAGDIPPAALPEAELPIAGPTPANPFGGGAFDLFEAIEEAEQAPQPAPVYAPPLPLPEPAALEMPPASMFSEPAPTVAPAAGLEPALTAPVAADAGPAEEEAATAAPPAPEPPAPEPPAEPLVKPIVIGADVPAAEKKRGWWRR